MIVFGYRGVAVDTALDPHRRARAPSAGVVHAAEHEGRAPVARGADLEQAQRVGDHRRRQHLLDGHFLVVPGVGVVEAVPGVFDLDLGEVLVGGAVERHPPPGVQGEVARVGGTEEPEAEPVRIVLAVATDRCEESLGRGVGADHEGDVTQAGEDLGPGRVDGMGAGRAGRVARRHPGSRPAEGLGHGGAGDEAGIAVADGVGTRHVLDIGPGQAGVGKGVAGRGDPVLHEVAAPFAPRVHAHTEDGYVIAHWEPPPLTVTGRHFQTT